MRNYYLRFNVFPRFQFACLFAIATAIFDIYCLAMAIPGSTHTGYYMISYEFVYVGNFHGSLWGQLRYTTETGTCHTVLHFFHTSSSECAHCVRNVLVSDQLFRVGHQFYVVCSAA